MEYVQSYEYQTFPPTRRTFNNLNEPGKDVEFEIWAGDSYIHPHRADLYIKFDVVGQEQGGTYDANANIKLVDNFVPHLFSQIEIRKHGTIIDRIDYPGIASTVVSTLTFSKSEAEALKAGGLITHDRLPRKENSVLFPLKLLFGFFSDYHDVMWKGGLKITFKNAASFDNVFYRWKTNANDTTLPHPAKIIIKIMELRVPIIEYQSDYDLKLKSQLLRSPSIPIEFHSFQCFQRHVTGIRFEYDVTNMFSSLSYDMPDFVAVVFQTGRNGTQERDSSKFDLCDVKNIYLKNSKNEIFPRETYDLQLKNHDFLKVYEAYTAYKRVVRRSTEMFYSPQEFYENRPIYLINTSKRKKPLTSDRTNIKIGSVFNSEPPAGTTCTVILCGRAKFVYDVKNDRVTELF